MLCIQPISLGTAEVGCGQCGPCRVNRRRDWVARMLLHHAGHVGESAFITLTYEDKHVPLDAGGVPCLCPGHVRWFMQRLRRSIGSLRYCVVGEFGERTKRPHYHAVLWTRSGVDLACAVREAWDKGFVDVGEISEASITYTVSYILKGVVNDLSCFARFSEGLGLAALPELRRCGLPDSDGVLQLPRQFRLNGHVWPVPKYLRSKLIQEGFRFARRQEEILEEGFVQALRGCASMVAADGIQAFRKDARQDVVRRRERTRSRFNSTKLTRKRYETL